MNIPSTPLPVRIRKRRLQIANPFGRNKLSNSDRHRRDLFRDTNIFTSIPFGHCVALMHLNWKACGRACGTTLFAALIS
jgi:hypothetical protein